MVIDLFDKASKQLVWRGTATATVSDDPKKNAKTIQKAVEKMFKNKLPPKRADEDLTSGEEGSPVAADADDGEALAPRGVE